MEYFLNVCNQDSGILFLPHRNPAQKVSEDGCGVVVDNELAVFRGEDEVALQLSDDGFHHVAELLKEECVPLPVSKGVQNGFGLFEVVLQVLKKCPVAFSGSSESRV